MGRCQLHRVAIIRLWLFMCLEWRVLRLCVKYSSIPICRHCNRSDARVSFRYDCVKSARLVIVSKLIRCRLTGLSWCGTNEDQAYYFWRAPKSIQAVHRITANKRCTLCRAKAIRLLCIWVRHQHFILEFLTEIRLNYSAFFYFCRQRRTHSCSQLESKFNGILRCIRVYASQSIVLQFKMWFNIWLWWGRLKFHLLQWIR